MIREFHKNELDAVIQLWMNAITKAHPSIPREHQLNQYRIVRNEHLSMVETFVYGEYGRLKGLVSIPGDSFIAAPFVDADNWNHGTGTELIRWCQEKYSHSEVNVYKKSENIVHFYTKHGSVIERELTNSDVCEQELFITWKRDQVRDKPKFSNIARAESHLWDSASFRVKLNLF